MESAKKQNSSRNAATSSDEFQPIYFKELEKPSLVKPISFGFKAEEYAGVDKSFHLSGNVWESLLGDEGIRADFEKILEERVSKKMEAIHQGLRETVTEEARQEGLALGLEEGKRTWQAAAQNLQTIAAQILKEKEMLLHEHEKAWCRAFGQLLKRFLIPREKEVLNKVESWLSDTLGRYAENKTIKIFLSADEYDRFGGLTFSQGEEWKAEWMEHWELIRDAQLKPGEVRCECEGAGIFFSPSAEMDQLESWIEDFTGKKVVE